MVNHFPDTILKSGHPAPQRHAASLLLLIFAIVVGPVGWMLQLLVAFAVTSYLCMSSEILADTSWLFPLLAAFSVLGLALAAAGLAVAWLLFKRTSNELGGQGGEDNSVLDIGEGRTRFMAMAGIFISLVSLVATLASTFSLILVPLCKL